MKNSQNIWQESGWKTIGGSDTTGLTHQLTISVLAGDLICFIVNQNGSNAADEINWNPTITFN